MKYGAELMKRSVPEWKAYNVDYDEIKDLIKKATSNSNDSKAIDRLLNALFEEYESVSDYHIVAQ